MYEELEYDSKLDQYTEVIFNEFSDSSDEEIENSIAPVNPLLILRKQRIR